MIHFIPGPEQISFDKFSKLFSKTKNFDLLPIRNSYGSESIFLLQTFFKNQGRSQQQGQGAGCSLDKRAAAFGAMGEALERYCFQFTQADFVDCSYQDLNKRNLSCLDPQSFKIFSEQQACILAKEAYNLNRRSKIDWTWAIEATNKGQKSLLPFQFFQFFKRKTPFYFGGSTSGNGCGQDPTGARLSALLEIIERDAVMYYWWSQNCPEQIDLSFENQRMASVFDKDDFEKINLHFLKTDLNVYTFLASYQGRPSNRQPRLAVTAASHLDPSLAADKALRELRHSLNWFQYSYQEIPDVNYSMDFDKTIWLFYDRAIYYSFQPPSQSFSFLFPAKASTYKLKELHSYDQGEANKNLDFIIRDFKKNKLRLFFKDISTCEVRRAGLSVQRAFSPDLISIESMHKFRHLGYPRLYELGNKLNLKRKPKAYSDLNLYPHPFP